MQRSLLIAPLLLALAGPAAAQTTTLQMDTGGPTNPTGALSNAWSLTSPNAGPNDWIGVAYEPPLEHPFRVVSASMFYIDTFCCQTLAPLCDATCGLFNDWERRVIAGADLVADPAGLTPDLFSPLVNQTPVGQNPPAFIGAGSNTTSGPNWTLTPDLWTLPAGTVFDQPGRLFYAVKYFNSDQWMRFVTDDSPPTVAQHPLHRAIFTNDGFATRSALWGFGNVGMRVTVEPVFFVKPAAGATPSEVLAPQSNVTMLAVRVGGGNAPTTVNRFEVDASGTGDDAAAITAVRLVLDLDGDGIADPTEQVLATGTFTADDGRVNLAPNRTLATGAAEEWLVVYDFGTNAAGGNTFAASITSAARVGSTLGAPFVSGTAGGTGSIDGPSVTVAGTLQIAAGPAAPAARVVPAGALGLPVAQVRLTANNEAFVLTGLAFTAQGTVNDLTDVTGVRLYDDANGNGAVDTGEAQLATGVFGANDARLALTFGAFTVPRNTSRDVLLVIDLGAAASGGDGFRAVLATAADVTASGLASGPLPLTGPRALTGAPVIGEQVTVGGALVAAVGAGSPTDGTAQPGATDVPMLQLTVSAQAEPVQITTVTFAGSGSGHEVLDIARAQLVLDANQNGAVDASDPRVGLPQSYASDDGLLTFALTGQTVPPSGSRSYLLAYDLTARPTGGETFAARIVDAIAIAATGQASAAPVVATGAFPLLGRTLTLLGGLSITVGPENPAPRRVQPGALDVPVLQLSAAAQGEVFTVGQVTLTAAGSLVDSAAITAVRIYRDQGVPGARDVPDVLLGTSSYALDDGTATFVFSPALSLSPGTPERWLITYDLAANPSPGQTFRTAVAGAADVLATGTISGPAAVSGLPASGPEFSVGGGLTISAGPANPAGGRLDLGGLAQPMLQVRLQTDLEPITVSALTVQGSGTGNEVTAVAGAHLYADLNADGVVDLVGDLALAGPVTFGANDGAATFTISPARPLPAGATETWLIAYDLGAAATAGETFAVTLAAATDVAAAAPSGPLPGVMGAPVAGGAKTLLGAIDATLGANDPPARTVARDLVDVPLMQVALQSTAEAFVVSSLTVDAIGSMDDVGDVGGVELVSDVDGSGTRTAGDLVLAGPIAFSSDDGTATFSNLGLNLAAGATANLLVTADLTGQAAGGASLRVRLPSGGITATGVQGRSAPVGGLPLSSNLLTAGGALEVGLGAGSPLGGVARRGDIRAPGLQLRFVSTTEPVDLTQVVLHGSGTGHEVSGLVEVELWLDADADGRVSAGESRVANGTFSADDGAVTLALAQTVQVGPALHLLATYSLSATPVGGQTFRLGFDPAPDLSISAASGAVVVDGVAVSGGLITVGGGFAVGPGANNGGSGLVNQALQNLAVLQVELEAVNERCTVEALTVRAAGSAHDTADITGVRLVYDANDDGAVSVSDVLVAGPSVFPNDDAELTFSGINRALAPNTSERWLLVYDLSGQASNLETFSARLEGPDRVQVRCQVSGALTPSGLPVQSGTFTVQEDGALVVRAGDQTPPARFVPAGTVRAAALQIRAAASVQPLTFDALTLTASVGAGPVLGTVAGVDLFLDVNQDGQLDRSDQLLATGTIEPSGRVGFTGLALPLPLDEAQYLLATVDVDPGAIPGARFALGLALDGDALASSGFGPAQTTGAPFFGATMTVAGGLNVAAGRPEMAATVANDATELVALDLTLAAVWERFTVRRLTVTAQGSMDPASAVRGLSLVEDVDGDGAVGAGDRPIASGLTFPEGSARTTFDPVGVEIGPGETRRILVVMDLNGVARVDETVQLVLASDLDLVAEGDRRGLSSPVGAPVAGDTFTVGASFELATGPNPPSPDVVPADARGIPVMQLTARSANEDVTLARLALSVSGSLDDSTGISAVHLLRDVDGDGAVDPEDIEVGAAARPAGDDGVITFAPLSERVAQNAEAHLLVTVDLSGGGRAGQDLTVRLVDDAAVGAFGARSGAVAARGAPIEGARIALVGAMNVRLGPASPAGQGVWPGTAFGALQLELFTRGEAVTVDSMTLALGPGGGASITQVDLVHDQDGDGLAGEGEPVLASATPVDDAAALTNLGLALGLDSATRVLAVVQLAEDAAPGGMIRVALARAEDLAVRGESGDPPTLVGPPVLGSAFTITRRPEPTGEGQAEGGCGCQAERRAEGGAPYGLGLLLVAMGLRRRSRGNAR